jgi:hypothetical protein
MIFQTACSLCIFSAQEMSIKFTNAFSSALAFLLELMAIAAYACVGVIVSGGAFIRYGVAIFVVSAVVALWAVFAAPRSPRRLTAPRLYYFKIAVFAGAAAVLLSAHRIHLAISFAIIAAVSLTLEANHSRL